MLVGRNLLQHQQWNYRHKHLMATSDIPLSSQVLYNLPVHSRQEHDKANLYPFPTLRNCLNHRICWRNVVQLQQLQFWVLMNEEPENEWLFVFNLGFGEFNFIQRTVRMVELFEQLTTNGCTCFFVSEVLRYKVLAPIYDLLTVGADG